MEVLDPCRNLLSVFGARVRLALLLAVTALSLWAEPGGGIGAGEYEIKAVFLFNFAQFVDWPPNAYKGPTDPLVIGIIGKDPFGAKLDETVRGEKVNNRAIVIRRIQQIEDVGSCQILFISRSEAGILPQILSGLGNKGVLTVSDIDDFSRLGGMIRFTTENSRVRLRINNGAATAAGLRISSKLLRPAEIVTTGKD